jgi:hypothetical protein
MKADIETLQDTFKIGYEAFEQSRIEAAETWNLYHNRQYTDDQVQILKNRGQPVETFNVIKLFARMLMGYYSGVVNTVVASPVQTQDIPTAHLLNNLISYTLRHNNFSAEGDKIKLSGIISGIMVSHQTVVETDKKDEFGRTIREIKTAHVPDAEVVLDPMSRLEDYSDSRYIHRFRWFPEDTMIKTFGKEAVEKLSAYENHLNIEEAEFVYSYNGEFTGKYKIFNNYLVVHSVIIDDDDKVWSVLWSADEILDKKEVTYNEVRPYRVQKLHTSDKTEYYGLFREIIETQKAINQALIKIQLMVSTQKAFVETGAVDDLAEFETAFNRVSGVIPINDLTGIKIESLSREVLDQYTIIDKAFDRIQRVLSINDSFLGMAFASDSGRKVKLQQNATITALRYLTLRIEEYYRLLGWDIANLAKQFYTAHQFIRVSDSDQGQRWLELNKPLQVDTGRTNPETGEPITNVVFEEVLDPESREPMTDEDGNILVAPMPTEESEIAYSDVDIEISSVAYNDEDEKNQLMMETTLSGTIGQMLSQVNPAGFFKASALAVKTMKTKHSPDISAILNETAEMLSGNPQAEAEASLMAQGNGDQNSQSAPLSKTQKLPQNTNEPVG